MPRFWTFLVLRDKFSTQRVKEALRMAKGHFETIKLYNLSVTDLIRLRKILQRAPPAVKTLYYETTDCFSIHPFASLGLKSDVLIVRNEDLQGPPISADLVPLFGPTLRTLSLHRSIPHFDSVYKYAPMLGSLTSLSITGIGFVDVYMLQQITMVEEIILDFKETLCNPNGSHINPSNVSLPSLRVFKLRHVPCPTRMSLPTLSVHAPKLHTFHLDSTSATLWLSVFSDHDVPYAIVDFRVDQPNGLGMGLSHLQPFLCDTIESFALTSVSHDLGPLLKDIHARRLLPRRKHLEFTFNDN